MAKHNGIVEQVLKKKCNLAKAQRFRQREQASKGYIAIFQKVSVLGVRGV
jgi:hypothetical protein